jgi:hypothetical protein
MSFIVSSIPVAWTFCYYSKNDQTNHEARTGNQLIMKRTATLAAGATIALLGGFIHKAQGQTYIYSTSTAAVSAWGSGTVGFETGATPQGNSGGSTQDNDNWGGNANGVNGFGSLGEAFVVGQSGYLSSAQVVLNGAAQTFNVELYDLGAAPADFPSGSPQGSNAGGTISSDITQYNSVTDDLLASPVTFTFNGTPSSPVVETLNFQGGTSTPLLLQTGQLYLLALDPTANADGTWWQRGGLPVTGYNLGEGVNVDGVDGYQDFEGKTTVRDFDTDITIAPVPEPSTMALFGLGALALCFARPLLFARQGK